MEVLRYLIHEALKRLGRVFKSEQHPDELEETKGRGDGRLRNVFLSDRDLMVAFDKINFAEDGVASEAGCEIVQVRDRVRVSGCGVVEPAIITTGMPRFVLLRDHMQPRAPGRT